MISQSGNDILSLPDRAAGGLDLASFCGENR